MKKVELIKPELINQLHQNAFGLSSEELTWKEQAIRIINNNLIKGILEGGTNHVKFSYYSLSHVVLTKSEKDLLKFGYFRGFDIFNWQRQMNKFISFSTNPEVGELKMKKTITSYTFQRIFPFIYTLISRGEKNEQFPRI